MSVLRPVLLPSASAESSQPKMSIRSESTYSVDVVGAESIGETRRYTRKNTHRFIGHGEVLVISVRS